MAKFRRTLSRGRDRLGLRSALPSAACCTERMCSARRLQHARASQGERPYRQEAAYTSTTRKNPRNDYLRIENIYCGSRKQRERERKKGREREGKRERGEKRRIVVCQIRNHETKNERREENKELWEAKPSI